MTTLRATLAASALLLLPAAAAAQGKTAPADLTPRTKGAASAPVTVYEMSDFQCPYCKRHADQTWPTLEREYVNTGKVRWVFINFPLMGLHPNAEPAAEVATCAARQNKFWPVHDLLFRNQGTWAPLKEPGAFFLTLADSAGLDKAALQQCLQSGAVRGEVEQDATSAVRSGARSTPTFYIEGGLLEGAQPVAVFREVIDSIYAAKTKK